MESFEQAFKPINCGIPQIKFWYKYVQSFLHKGVNHVLEKYAIIPKKSITMKYNPWVYEVFLERNMS